MNDDYTQRWLAARFEDHEAWNRARLGVKEGDTPPAPPSDEELQVARAERQAAIDAHVRGLVATYRPDLLADADRRPKTPGEPQPAEVREAMAAAEAFFRSKS